MHYLKNDNTKVRNGKYGRRTLQKGKLSYYNKKTIQIKIQIQKDINYATTRHHMATTRR